MSKTHNKTLAVKVPVPMFDKFKELCDANFKSMSDTIRDFIRERIETQVVVRWEDGSMGAVSQEWLNARGWQTHPGVVWGKKCEVVKSFSLTQGEE